MIGEELIDDRLPHGWDFEDVPLDGSIKLGQINADVDDITATNFVDVSKINLPKMKMKMKKSSISLSTFSKFHTHVYHLFY